MIAVSTADAGDMARKAARREGIWTGRSGGANLTAAPASPIDWGEVTGW